MAGVIQHEELDPIIENLIRRASTFLSFGLSECEARDLLVQDTFASEREIYFAIKAAGILSRSV